MRRWVEGAKHAVDIASNLCCYIYRYKVHWECSRPAPLASCFLSLVAACSAGTCAQPALCSSDASSSPPSPCSSACLQGQEQQRLGLVAQQVRDVLEKHGAGDLNIVKEDSQVRLVHAGAPLSVLSLLREHLLLASSALWCCAALPLGTAQQATHLLAPCLLAPAGAPHRGHFRAADGAAAGPAAGAG